MMFAISIWLITSQRLLLPSSSTDYVINASYDTLSSCEEHNRFTTFHRCTMHGLGSTSPPVGVSSASGELGTPEPPTYLLVKHLSIFRLFSITTFSSGSPALAIPCFALAPHRLMLAVVPSPHGFETVLTDAATLSQAHLIQPGRALRGRTPGKILLSRVLTATPATSCRTPVIETNDVWF
jgi:hypothetical protein